MNVTGQLHAPAVLLQKKGSLFLLNIKLSGSRTLFRQFVEQKSFLPQPGIEPRSPKSTRPTD